MPRKKKDALVLDDGGGGERVSIDLPPGVTARARTSSKTGRRSVTLEGYGGSVLLSERSRGSIELRAPWIPALLGQASDRISSRTSLWPKAVAAGLKLLTSRHDQEDRLQGLERGVLRLHDALHWAREKNLLPGDDATETGIKARRGYQLVCDLAEAILHTNPVLPLQQEHVNRYYDVRERQPGEDKNAPAGFEWPQHIERRPAKRVRPKTVQKNLEDLLTVLRRLEGTKGPHGKLIRFEVLADGVDIGDHPSQRRDTAGYQRAGLVLHTADEATELMRSEGFLEVYNRTGPDGSVHSHTQIRRLARVVPGMLRAMLSQCLTHPVRPKAHQHVRIDDVALNRKALVSLVRSFTPNEREWQPTDEVFDIWQWGAIRYRAQHSKLGQNLLLPLTEDLQQVLLDYIDVRNAWLAQEGVESDFLYPCPRSLDKACSETDARLLLLKGEQVAREKLPECMDPEEYIPDFHGTAWYAYRRAWKAARNELGWEGTRAAEYVGDWGYTSGRTADVVYAGMSPRVILALVQGKTRNEAMKEAREGARMKDATRITPIDPGSLL